MTRAERMRRALESAFQPAQLDIIDESHRHAGHSGTRPEGETHYKVVIRAPALSAMMPVARHRAINKALDAEFQTGLHALSIDAG